MSAPPRQVAVDMTALEPGGSNGGAGVVAVSLMRELARLAPEIQFSLLTASASHAELAPLELERGNVRRVQVLAHGSSATTAGSAARRARHTVRDRLRTVVGPQAMARLRSAYWSVRYRAERTHTLRHLGSELYFCPFTTGLCVDPLVPRISIVHDVQHALFPEFFTPEQRHFRQQQLARACRDSVVVVCVSEHVRETVLSLFGLPAERVVTIHHALLRHAQSASAPSAENFLLYPANFWPHKNHVRLLEAFARYRTAHPRSGVLKLVCTGVLDERGRAIRARAAELGLGDAVEFPGYVSDQALEGLLRACRALIYPSLYEGFGLPVVEAMACGKPVLCSRVGSLEEVAGDAATFFDPRDGDAIRRAIEWLDGPVGQIEAAIDRGRARAASFDTPARMAERYLALFEQAAARSAAC